jgi:hypothetical protein
MFFLTIEHKKSGCCATLLLVLPLFQTTQGREKFHGPWFTVWHDASQDSNQFLFQGQTEFRGWRVLRWVSSLALSKWYHGTAAFWANSQNRSTL